MESQPTALIGRKLGPYEILALLGRGGMGVVYLAEDSRLRRRVALKVLPQEMSASPERLKRFRREAKTVAALSHPNIVTLHSVEEADGFHFLTMELVEGETLADAIPHDGFSVERAIDVAQALASALAAAHERGVLHRDLKPSNVMVAPSGWVKVLDFGLAKLRPEDELTWLGGDGTSLPLTQEGKILGTPSYMSPEQLRGQPADERSDVFSFGLIFFEMLSGRLPFAGDTSAERIASVLRDAPRPLPELRPETPPVVVRVVERCLQKDPEKRFAGAAALRDEIAALRRELEISKLIESGAIRQTRPRRKISRWEVLGAATAFVLLVGLGLRSVLAPASDGSASSSVEAVVEAARPSIAVLPLRNFSGDPDYFVDGMTDALIGALARLRGMRVVSRQSAMHFKGSDKLLDQIAQELGVDFLVEGSVAREGDRVHLQARLVRPRPEEQLFAEAFQRPATEILALHDDVARALATAAGVALTSRSEARPVTSKRVDPAVYEAYLQGRYWAGKFRSEDLVRARGYLERAVALDPTFAPAWSSLGEVLAWLGKFHLDTRSTMREAEAAAQRALQADPNDALAYSVLSEVEQTRWQWDGGRAPRRVARSSSTPARRRLAASSGASSRRSCRFDEAQEQIELAAKLDPLSAQIASLLGIQLMLEERFDEAEAVLTPKRSSSIPTSTWSHAWFWNLYAQDGQGARSKSRAGLGTCDVMGFQEIGAELERRIGEDGYETALVWAAHRLSPRVSREVPTQVGVIAGLLAEAGETEEALALARVRASSSRSGTCPGSPSASTCENLHGTPEFDEASTSMGLPRRRRSVRAARPDAGLGDVSRRC